MKNWLWDIESGINKFNKQIAWRLAKEWVNDRSMERNDHISNVVKTRPVKITRDREESASQRQKMSIKKQE